MILPDDYYLHSRLNINIFYYLFYLTENKTIIKTKKSFIKEQNLIINNFI